MLNSLGRDMDADKLRPQVVVTLHPASRIRGGRPTALWLNTPRLPLFDPKTGENLTLDAAEGARLTEEANAERTTEIQSARQEASEAEDTTTG